MEKSFFPDPKTWHHLCGQTWRTITVWGVGEGTDGTEFLWRKLSETEAHLHVALLVGTSMSRLFGPGRCFDISFQIQGLSIMGHPQSRRSEGSDCVWGLRTGTYYVPSNSPNSKSNISSVKWKTKCFNTTSLNMGSLLLGIKSQDSILLQDSSV